MKSIQRRDFIIAGVVEKAHGTKGELRLSLEQKIQLKEWVFLELHGKPVPFFIESVSKDPLAPVVKLERIGSPAEAGRFAGVAVLVPGRLARKMRAADIDITGYMLVDEKLGVLGSVEEVEELPQQLLIHTTYGGRELLIPAVGEFILRTDDKKKIVYLQLPEGIIHL